MMDFSRYSEVGRNTRSSQAKDVSMSFAKLERWNNELLYVFLSCDDISNDGINGFDFKRGSVPRYLPSFLGDSFYNASRNSKDTTRKDQDCDSGDSVTTRDTEMTTVAHDANRCERKHTMHSSDLSVGELVLSVGSANHHKGTCSPCAFYYTGRCKKGKDCAFCHLCDNGEFKRQKKIQMKNTVDETKPVKAEELKRRLAKRKNVEEEEKRRKKDAKAEKKKQSKVQKATRITIDGLIMPRTRQTTNSMEWNPMHVPM